MRCRQPHRGTTREERNRRTPHAGNDSDSDPSVRPCTAIIWCRRRSPPGEDSAAVLELPPPEWRGVRGPSGVEGSERLPISLGPL